MLLINAGWLLVNGIAHTVAILAQKRPFDKELIRLLQDGHFLIFTGVFFGVAWFIFRQNPSLAYILTLCISICVLSYCLLILKLIPSVGTMLIATVTLVWTFIQWIK